MNYFIAILFGYLMGAVSYTAITAKIYKVDLTKIGSKSIGGTNLSRAVGWKIAIFPSILDAVKTLAVFFIMHYVFKSNYKIIMLAGGFSVVGHVFPFWNKFYGGKGVASMIGFAFATQNFWIPFTLCMIMILINKKFKYMFGATLIVVNVILISSYFASSSIVFDYPYGGSFIYTMLIWALVMVKHQKNFKDLFAGKIMKSGK